MKAHVSTDLVPAPDKIALWVDMVCAHLVQVDCRHVTEPERFAGSVSKLSLPQLEIAQIRAGGQTVRRTSEQISRADEEFLLVNIQRSGEGLVRQNGRDAVLKPGDLAIYSSTSPYELAFNQDFEQTVLIFPASAMPHVRDNIHRLSAMAISGNGNAARLLGRLADSTYDTAEGLPATLLPSLVHTMLQTLSAAMHELGGSEKPSNDLGRYHVARIKAYALAHLYDPELSVDKMASAAGVSVSHLHRLFLGEETSIMEWIREQRLLGCSRDLSDMRKSRLSVSEIAYQWGFNDASHFSRAFRARFGMAPREWRQQQNAQPLSGQER